MTFTSVTDDCQSSRYLENVPQAHTFWGPTLKVHDRQMWVELSMCHQVRGARRCIKKSGTVQTASDQTLAAHEEHSCNCMDNSLCRAPSVHYVCSEQRSASRHSLGFSARW